MFFSGSGAAGPPVLCLSLWQIWRDAASCKCGPCPSPHTSIPRIRGPVTGAYYSCADERARRSLWLCALGVSPSRSTYPWCARQRVQTEVRVLGFANTLCQLWTRFLTPARQPCAKICLALFAHLELVDAVRDTRALHASFAVDPRAHSHVYSKACPCQKLHMRP
ncbi:hypothetical protein DFH94DRAFT_75317 [Russula ochroleuca]|jgi:hypothetical protein|uniref:Uncharacterized protein n=1 Tax=Russula ochroleuca TaxID=152965 RepID=A0A9P5MSX5_9AGAM|nr:hypothetical protein DFH94DRAFT_75317 [Russula ochroleuca]